MPFIHIRSLPFDPVLDIKAIIEHVSEAVSRSTGTGIQHIVVTWEFFEPDHYAAGGRTAASQQRESHPVLVDLVAPDFNGQEMIEKMFEALVSGIASQTPVDPGNIFINFRPANSGRVFDQGRVVRW